MGWGGKFWDQTYTICFYNGFFQLKIFFSWSLKKFLHNFNVCLLHFYMVWRGHYFYIYLLVFRSISFFKNKKVSKKWKLGRTLSLFLRKDRYFKKPKAVGRVGSGAAFSLIRKRGHSRWRSFKKLFNKSRRWRFLKRRVFTRKFLFFFRCVRSSILFKANKAFLGFSSRATTTISNKSAIKTLFGFFLVLFRKKNFLFLKAFDFNKKAWLLKLFFQFFISRKCGTVLSGYTHSRRWVTNRTRCLFFDVLNFWQAGLASLPSHLLNFRREVGSSKHRWFSFIRPGLRLVQKKTKYVWKALIFYFYASYLTKNWFFLLKYLVWLFETWERKKQRVFRNFIKNLFSGFLYSRYTPRIQNRGWPFFFLSFKGRIDGKHRARLIFLRPLANAKPKHQNLMHDVSSYFRQSVTKFGVYGIRLWVCSSL